MDISNQTSNIADVLVNNMLASIVDDIKAQVKQQILSELAIKLNQIDLNQAVRTFVQEQVQEKIKTFTFPESSIPGSSIVPNSIYISADNLVGGTIKKFSSTGIEDQASTCQVTVLDEFTVIENNLVTADLTVKGSTTIEGDLIIQGQIPTDGEFFKSISARSAELVNQSINQNLFENFSGLVFEKIKTDGIDLSKISVNGKNIINENKLDVAITESSLQKVGILNNLQTKGESYLAQTLYASEKRVGINTVEPTHTLTLWDEEVEVVAAKRKADTAMIGTVRAQSVILSSGGKENIVMTPDGATAINKLNLGAVTITSAMAPPNYDAPNGTVVFNGNPSLGGPMGWVSLGGARWANFGIIE